MTKKKVYTITERKEEEVLDRLVNPKKNKEIVEKWCKHEY